jgi:lipoyl(octanoyl) transferase
VRLGNSIPILDLGRLAYAPALTLQRTLHAAISTHSTPQLNNNIKLPDLAHGIILLVEHDPVITVTHRAAETNILLSREALAEKNIALEETDRGGDVTYHAPGQLVVYPILRLDDYHLNLSRYMRLLEHAVIDTLATWHIDAQRIAGRTGVWVNNEKICAMGVRISRGATLHGLALNVNLDLAGFDAIVPCGIADTGVTSLAKILGEDQPAMSAVKSELSNKLIDALRNSHRKNEGRSTI